MKDTLFEFKPDARDSSPLYVQLARKLGQAIRDGQYPADAALPSERLLSESLDVSRVTARKAIDQLVDQGLIVRRRGSGNYIAPRIEQPLSRLTSFSRSCTSAATRRRRSGSSARSPPPCPTSSSASGLSPGARVAKLERLRLADDVVMAYEISVLPQNVLPNPEGREGIAVRIPDEHAALAGARVAAHPRAERTGAARRAAGRAARPGGAVHHPDRIPRVRSGGRADAFVLPQRLLRFRGEMRRDA
jgi:DNA-binding GntR family transcriptional regulator